MITKDLQLRVKAIAEPRGESLKDVARACGLGVNALYQARNLSADAICALADYLDCTADYLLGRGKILTARDIEEVVDAINAGAGKRDLIDRYGADLVRNWTAIEGLALLERREEAKAGTGSAPAGAGK